MSCNDMIYNVLQKEQMQIICKRYNLKPIIENGEIYLTSNTESDSSNKLLLTDTLLSILYKYSKKELEDFLVAFRFLVNQRGINRNE